MAGRHKLFLGMAAGVGKTYRMLQEGQAEAESGRDVVLGYLETHDRPETTAQAAGLELVPRRRVVHGTRAARVEVEEMDLPAILLRAPELCLVDELAHTNAPGQEHAKRWEDVEAVLDAGIDVYSTVNVQHLESLNDRISELTGTRVRETVPDALLVRADEVVLVDLTPEALTARLRAGKVYARERAEAALNGFFKIEHLGVLREVALRQVAEGVGSQRLVREGPAPLSATRREDRLADRGAPQAVGERLLALVRPEPAGQRVVRRAWRSSQRLGAELDLLCVRTPGAGTSEADRIALESLRRLASVLGAHLLVEEGDDVADVAVRVARERGTTYVLMGMPRTPRGLGRLAEVLPMTLLRRLPGVDLRVVADRTARAEEE